MPRRLTNRVVLEIRGPRGQRYRYETMKDAVLNTGQWRDSCHEGIDMIRRIVDSWAQLEEPTEGAEKK